MHRSLGLTINLLLASLLLACGGSAPAATTEVGEPPSTTPTAGSSPILTQTAMPTLVPEPCEHAAPRDDGQHFAVSFGDPICVRVDPAAGATVTLTAEGRPTETFVVPAAQATVVVPEALSPYAEGGCATDPGFRLTIRYDAPSLVRPLEAVAMCALPADDCPNGPPFTGDPPGPILTGQCIMWDDRWSDELWFRVDIWYVREGTSYSFLMPADSEAIHLPDEAAPRLEDSPERFGARKDFGIEIWRAAADGSQDLVFATFVQVG